MLGRKGKKEQSEKDENIAKEVSDKFSKSRSNTKSYVHDYMTNHAFLLGNQWVWLNPVTETLYGEPRDPDRVQATMNRLWPASRTIIGKLTQRALTFDVLPNGSDDVAVRASRTAEAILSTIHRTHQWEAKRESAAWAAWKGGTAIICVDWDPKANSGVTLDSGEELPSGDSIETVLSISEAYLPPGTKSVDQAIWWIKAQTMPSEDVKRIYDLEKLPPADGNTISNIVTSRMDATEGNASMTKVLTYYERPNRDRPEGMICVVVDNKIVEGPGPWPFPWKDKLNFAIIRETSSETHWPGITVMTQARPVQMAYNASWSSVIEHMKNAGNARLAVPTSSIEFMDQATDLAGEFLPYPDGSALPEYISPPSMPNWWVEQPEHIKAELDDQLGVHDVSRGVSPANIESGYGLSILAEQDSTPVGRMVKDMAIAFGEVASMVLKLYEAEVGDSRKATIQVEGLPPEEVHWTGSDISGQTTAIVPLEAIIPKSRATSIATADKMVQMGLITDPEMYYEVAELSDRGQVSAITNPDAAKARRENHMMAIGSVMIPATFDVHAIHIKELNDFRKSARYENLPQDIKNIFDQHVTAHETMEAEEAGRQAAKLAMSPTFGQTSNVSNAPMALPEQLPTQQ